LQAVTIIAEKICLAIFISISLQKKLMPARDVHHAIVRIALEKDGWNITHDPYFLRLGRRKGYIDLAANLIIAEKESEIIAVEIKGFIGVSDLDQFEDALGQFLLYKLALRKKEPNRRLYLAVPNVFFEKFFDDAFFLEAIEYYKVSIVTFDINNSTIEKWIKFF
jgi:XisH protein